jgi:hypothetical protein
VDTSSLYQGPLEDFIARRTSLVRELRPTDPDAAAAIAKLRKPPVGVWAINQLAVASPGVITELLAAGADARYAHQNVATGSERREDLLVASGRLRDLVDSAARAAAAVLEGAGHAASDETDRRIRATLQAAATGDAARRGALWKGTLDRDLDATGFGAAEEFEDDLAELAEILAPMRRSSSPQAESASQGRSAANPDLVARRQAERDAAGLRATAKRARGAADAKRRQADRLAEEALGAAVAASAAEGAADVAEEAASRAEAALDP